ncbi:NlpC/P60 family protein [Streptomyces olivaceus]|uniref:C40 family peptidase n=1 Tax=Streptomyces olivaceus TaxID=47716 RepID=A0ABS7VW74_STROV|nr:C40 family peptidase [Streptomyces olivaceus]AOW88706.1 glycoside hydrolase [Streptomyces olivaceus]MBZ6079804.1 C40 family peptidase [Streptomyces olivaceus]MBZ6087098.1 C40 family peptidase [Streptomyces olivaceus]MBZ6094301.1 C40 family peptidase [Streptomyces olivaceus]MBZ6115417.1 C40 family peptidase [Streptomyces olivaceus]
MASHRKSRSTGTRVAGIRTPALATAALTSVALLSQTANAAPSDDRPSLEEVEKKVDDLYRQAGSATEKYNAAKEKTSKQRKKVDTLLDDVAKRTQKLNDARTELGSFASAQYRTGASVPETATLLLADSPQDYFDQNQLMDRLTGRQKTAVDDYVTQQSETMKKRQEATEGLDTLTDSQNDLKTAKSTVQKKLATARELLSELTAEEKARLAAIEKKKQKEAARKAAELAKQQAEEEAERKRQEEAAQQQGSGSSSGSSESSAPGSSNGTQAQKALAFAQAQIGKPYVWGATGPGSYDCSGLTQAAWKAAGVTLPRTTYDQVNAGTTVSVSQAQPGDLVFFYDDISHVGLYVGDGKMVHAPKPGAYVREESIFYDGESSIYSVVRPA